ncbi:unnamed protein product, partial [marine sediment metagenome]
MIGFVTDTTSSLQGRLAQGSHGWHVHWHTKHAEMDWP